MNETMPKSVRNSIIGAIIAVVLLIATTIIADFTFIEGNQVGIKETWSNGVEDKTYQSGMYILMPGWSQTLYKYTLTPQIFVMNDNKQDERANGRPNDAYIAKSADNQQMKLSLALQWRYDQDKIVDIHKRYRTHAGDDNWSNIIEERLIRQILMGSVNTEATKLKAIDAYSGEGFVRLQQSIFDRLVDPNGELRSQGIVIENFVIEQIQLDSDYIGEISKRQVAQQRELRAKQEELAALAEAQKAKAEAQADYERRVVEAERDKQVQVLASEASAQQSINAAKAEAEKIVLAANAEKQSAEARAAAILAVGRAEAESQKLKLGAYAVPGADSFVQIEVSKQMAEAFKNIQGYLPSDMKINILSENFMKSIQQIVKPVPLPLQVPNN